MNTNIKISIYLALICVQLTLLGWMVYDMLKPEYTDIHSGQIWVYEYREDNPFKNAYRDTNIVIDVKGDYVLYRNSWSDSLSSSKRWFIVGSRLIK